MYTNDYDRMVMNMAVMDEFKAEREYLKKHGTRQEKLAYFWDYYKWHTIVGVAALIFIISSFYNALTAKDVVLNGILLNSTTMLDTKKQDDLILDFMTKQEINTKKNKISFNTSLQYTVFDDEEDIDYTNGELTYTASQIMMVQVASGDLDFITGDLEILTSIAYSEYFVDLTTVLNEEQLALYEPYLYYLDQSVLELLNESAQSNETTQVTIPDVDKPETMKTPVPVMIDLSRCEDIKIFYPNMKEDKPIVMGFIANSKHAEMTGKFLDYLMNKGE